MTLSELIKNLQTIEARTGGSLEVGLTIRDNYDKYGTYAPLNIDASANMGGGYFINDNQLRIQAWLTDDLNGKHPKVTFRA